MRRRQFTRGLGGAGLALLASGCGPHRSANPAGEGAEPRGAEAGEAKAEVGPSRLRVVTYNVLADEVATAERIPAVFRVLREARPDLIALQEVAPWFLPWVADTPWLREYFVAEIDGAPARPNGQFILSRFPVPHARALRLPGAQGRSLLVAHVELGGGERLALGTTHMESLLEDGPVRARQLDAIFAAFERERDDPQVAATIFCGDLNFGDGERPDTDHLDPEFVDAWTALRPGEPGHTWDIERSDMARAGSFPGEPSRRLDRVLVRGSSWRPASIEIIGDEPVVPGQRGLFPSDHFGLVAELERV